MSKEFQMHAFEPFAQEGKETITGYSGSGLGLSIVKDTVELMGGTITLEKVNLSGKKVLLVEDNMLNMEIAHAMLEEEGLYISEAKTEVMVQEKVRKEE